MYACVLHVCLVFSEDKREYWIHRWLCVCLYVCVKPHTMTKSVEVRGQLSQAHIVTLSSRLLYLSLWVPALAYTVLHSA